MRLPLFPLHVVLFPGRPLPLHLFEPRYRVMLADCLAADRRFGVVAIKAGREVGGDAEIFDVGTVAAIESVTELADGRCDIVTRGVQRFRVRGLLDGAPYLVGDVELLDEPPASTEDEQLASRLHELLVPYLADLGAPAELLDRLPAQPSALSWLAASAIQVEVPEQQRVLECESLTGRLVRVLQVLRREAALMRHLGTVASLRPPGPGGSELN